MSTSEIIDRLRVTPEAKVVLRDFPTTVHDSWEYSKEETKERFHSLRETIIELQELLYASKTHALLVLFQAVDAGGKDSCIRKVFKGINPLFCRAVSFTKPTKTEKAHDFLWRVHKEIPPKGYLGVFNRSHYEDVLVPRVKGELTVEQCRRRMDHINNFEQFLTESGVKIVKFYLHVSKEEQMRRLQKRLHRSDKHWKFDAADFEDRKHWQEYQSAYEDLLERCSTEYAPWYIIPADQKWFRNYLVAKVVVETCQALDLKYPPLDESAKRYLGKTETE